MKRNRIIALALATILLVGMMSGCGSKPAAEPEKPANTETTTPAAPATPSDGSYNVDNMETLNLKICTSANSSSFDTPGYTQAIKFFADEVTSRSNGKVTVTVYPDSQLGSSGDEMVTGATTGAFEFCTMGNGAFGEFTDAWMDFNLPFLFDTQEQADAYLDGPRGEEISQQCIDDIGLRVLSFFDIGFRQTTSNREIHNANDFKGLKIRTQSDKYQMACFDSMGASTMTVSLAELYSALQQGLCDAQENPTVNIIQKKFYEVQDYVTLTGHNFGLTTMMVSEDAFQSWSTDVQNLMIEVGKEAQELCREGLKSTTSSDIEYLKSVCTVYEPTAEEKQTFKDATAPVYDMVREAIGDARYEHIMECVEAVK